jgi:hyperosmotically inducible protein
MKKSFLKLLLLCTSVAVMSTTIVSCKSKVKDEDVKTAAESALKANPDLQGVTVSVADGVASLSGEVKDDASKAAAESAVKAVNGVKSVNNSINVTPAPVPGPAVTTPAISGDDELKKTVVDAVKDNTGVTAEVKDSVITLTGTIKKSELPKLMQKLHALKPKKVENKLTVK